MLFLISCLSIYSHNPQIDFFVSSFIFLTTPSPNYMFSLFLRVYVCYARLTNCRRVLTYCKMETNRLNSLLNDSEGLKLLLKREIDNTSKVLTEVTLFFSFLSLTLFTRLCILCRCGFSIVIAGYSMICDIWCCVVLGEEWDRRH